MAGELNGGAIIRENQSLMREIIKIWSDLAKDDDLGVRITTLLATVAAFACIAAFSLFVLVMLIGGPESEVLKHRLLTGTFVLLLFFFFDGSVIAFRSSQRAPIRQLEQNFEEVARHRYGPEAVAEPAGVEDE